MSSASTVYPKHYNNFQEIPIPPSPPNLISKTKCPLFHRSLIPFFQFSFFPLSLSSNVPLFGPFVFPLFHYSILPLFRCVSFPLLPPFHYSLVLRQALCAMRFAGFIFQDPAPATSIPQPWKWPSVPILFPSCNIPLLSLDSSVCLNTGFPTPYRG